jgi:hypothetical protein
MGRVKDWSWKCEYPGEDIEQIEMDGEKCGPACDQHPTCTHFTYDLETGVCHFRRLLKTKMPVSNENRFCGRVCGLVNECLN